MQLILKNYQKQNHMIRCFFYKNLHQIPSTIEKATLFYTIKKDVSLKPLIKLATLLELVTSQRAQLLRSKKALIHLKIRKGAPLGVKVTLRKKSLSNFLQLLIWEIFPNIKNYKLKNTLQKSKYNYVNIINFNIVDPLIFPVLRPFFFLFKSCTNLRFTFSFKANSLKEECFFNSRFIQLPV